MLPKGVDIILAYILLWTEEFDLSVYVQMCICVWDTTLSGDFGQNKNTWLFLITATLPGSAAAALFCFFFCDAGAESSCVRWKNFTS